MTEESMKLSFTNDKKFLDICLKNFLVSGNVNCDYIGMFTSFMLYGS